MCYFAQNKPKDKNTYTSIHKGIYPRNYNISPPICILLYKVSYKNTKKSTKIMPKITEPTCQHSLTAQSIYSPRIYTDVALKRA